MSDWKDTSGYSRAQKEYDNRVPDWYDDPEEDEDHEDYEDDDEEERMFYETQFG